MAAPEAKIRIKAEVFEKAEVTNSDKCAWLDFEEVGKELIVRSKKDGDRFYPLGMQSAKKLQDFFIDCKVPLEKRNSVPIVESAGRIVWVAGLRIDDRAKVTAHTKKAVKLTLEKL